MTDAIRIAMWSGPRNISTTMMRSFGNRPDTAVVDEPFYACYLKTSGADHPFRDETLAAMPTDWKEVLDGLNAPLPDAKSILFEKHIAYHYPEAEPLDWLTNHRTFLLIRDPRLMVASFARKFDDVKPIVDSYATARRVFDFLNSERLGCPIVDAADILADPPAMLRSLCAELEIDFTDKMLSWPAGPRHSDGPWAPHWYDAVAASTGFRAPKYNAPDLTDHLAQVAGACGADYSYLHARRLNASPERV